jgi:hypothetical protein
MRPQWQILCTRGRNRLLRQFGIRDFNINQYVLSYWLNKSLASHGLGHEGSGRALRGSVCIVIEIRAGGKGQIRLDGIFNG